MKVCVNTMIDMADVTIIKETDTIHPSMFGPYETIYVDTEEALSADDKDVRVISSLQVYMPC